MSHRKYTSILDIDLSASLTKGYTEILNSPRTLEAMSSLGIDPTELDDQSYDTIKQQILKREMKKQVPAIIVDLRYDNF